MARPDYRFGIYDLSEKCLVINPETGKPYFFEYAIQAENFIGKRFNGSPNFIILDKNKR